MFLKYRHGKMTMDADKVSYKPLYLQVKDILAKRIVNGVYRRGEAIPSETKLAEGFGTSISTIRQALSILVADGVLLKKQGKGTYVSDKTTKISFYTWIGETKRGEEILSGLIELFQKKHPSLTIECIPTEYHAAKKNLAKLISSGNAPDVVHIQSFWTSYFASLGALERLDTLLNKNNLDHRFYEKDILGGLYQGKLYSVAWGLCPVSLIVNKNILQEVGIQILELPMTFEILFDICKRIESFYKTKEKYCYGLSMLSDKETDFLTVYFFLQAFQGGFLNEQGKVIFNSTGNITGFTWLRDFVKSFRIYTSDVPTIRKRFALGDIAFISDGPWIKYQLEGSTGEAFEKNFQVVLNPIQPGSHSYSWNYNHALAVCAQSQHKLYAVRFIDEITNDYDISNYYYSQAGNLPVNKTYLDDPMYDSEFFYGYKRQLTYANCINAQNAMFDKAMLFCVDAVKKILFEDADIEQELNEKEYYLNMLYYNQ
jgi:ABC-type glycerol-3-phosphate transport system substrate-binding protein